MKTYYKVVRRNGDVLTSCYAPSKELTIDYALGREVVAPVGGLLVFEDRQKAIEFGHDSLAAEVLRCTGWDPVPLPPKRYSNLLIRLAAIGTYVQECEKLARSACEDLWTRGVFHDSLAVYCDWPEGTVAVKRLVPLECVYRCP